MYDGHIQCKVNNATGTGARRSGLNGKGDRLINFNNNVPGRMLFYQKKALRSSMPVSSPLHKSSLVLGTMDSDALVDRLECLLAWLTSGFAKDELGLEAPLGVDVVCGSNLLIDQRVVMLQVGTKSLGFKCGPHYTSQSVPRHEPSQAWKR